MFRRSQNSAASAAEAQMPVAAAAEEAQVRLPIPTGPMGVVIAATAEAAITTPQ